MGKLKRKMIVKYDGPDKYVFRNGVAKMPGVFHTSGKPYMVTLKQFNEWMKNDKKNAEFPAEEGW